MWWNYLSIPKLQQCCRWSLEWISSSVWACDYVSMLGLKLIFVKGAPTIHLQFVSTFPFCFPFSNELKYVKFKMLCQAAMYVPEFGMIKLVALLMFMSYTLGGHSLSSEAVFTAVALFNPVMFLMTVIVPNGIRMLSELAVTMARLQVIRGLGSTLLINLLLPYLITVTPHKSHGVSNYCANTTVCSTI